MKHLDQVNTRRFLYQNSEIRYLISEDRLKEMEIDGSDIADKNLEKHLRKYWGIKNDEDR